MIDVTNPLDFSNGMPPTLIQSLSNSNSLGEEIQKNFQEIKVVKTLNTMWCGLMVNPELIIGGNHVNFICGNDSDSKNKVCELIHAFGWKNETILDLGDIGASRGMEGAILLWLRIMGLMKGPAFNYNIVS